MGAKKSVKKSSLTKKAEKQLQGWAQNGGGEIPQKQLISEPKVELRYSVDMLGFKAVMIAVSNLIPACRLLTALTPNVHEEKAIDRLKYFATVHGNTLAKGEKPDPEFLQMTIYGAQRILDAFQSAYDEFMAGAVTRLERFTKDIREMAPQLLPGENEKALEWLKRGFRDTIASPEATPTDVVKAYKAWRAKLHELDGIARQISKNKEKRKEEKRCRQIVGNDILEAISKF